MEIKKQRRDWIKEIFRSGLNNRRPIAALIMLKLSLPLLAQNILSLQFTQMNPNFDKPFTFDRVMRIGFTTIVLVAFFLLMRRLSGALVPFLVSWLIAYLLNPLVNFTQIKLRFKHRGLSIVFVLIFVLCSLAASIYFLTSPIKKEAIELSIMIKNFAQSNHDLAFLPDKWVTVLQETASMESVQEFFTIDKMTQWAKEIWPRLWSVVAGSLNVVGALAVVFIMLLYVIFILLDFENISQGWIKLVPDKYRDIVGSLAEDIKFSMNKYYRNQALIAVIVGTLFSIGFSIIGLPMAIVMGAIVMILNLVPYMQTLAIPPIILLVLLKSIQTDQSFGMGLLMFAIVFAIVQGLQDGFLVPRIMGKAMGMNPAVVILSLSVWGSLLGVAGMVIALPFTSLMTTYYRRFVLYEDIEGEAFSAQNPPPKHEDIVKEN